MSTRYTLTIRNKKDPERLFDSYQLFGNDDYIREIHDFVANLSSNKNLKIKMNEDSDFFVELNSESLTGLYKVIDDYCLKLCKENPKVHRYIDIMSMYNKFQERGIKSDFGSCCYNINFDSIYALQSAYLFQILFKHRGVRCLEGECEIKPEFTVEFEYH